MSTWSSNKVKVNGISLHYHGTGGDKPPLVLAHGITDYGLGWTRTAQALEDEFDIIMVDARGHGQSDKPEIGYSAGDHAADLAGLIEALGLTQPALIGHSMGARTVATLAAEYPHFTKRIVLEDPPWRPTEEPPATRIQQFQELIAKYHIMSHAEIVAFGRENNPAWDEAELDLWAKGKPLVSPNVVQFVDTSSIGWRDIVPKITCPALLVIGDPDLGGIVTADVAQAITEARPNFQVAHIAGAGHNIRRDQLAAYLAALKPFLQEG